ncbi:MAG: TIGR03619 family F420-dependent LLM class oxidoreductase [Actinomycetota bacterium]
MEFHLAISFLESEQIMPLAKHAEHLGYAGIYVSDHLFNLDDYEKPYTYTKREDGNPGFPPGTSWPDPMVAIGMMAGACPSLSFTTGVYIAPMRDLMTVAKTVGTAAALSDNRVRLGIGVGWCKEEFDLTGQDYSTRGKRLDEMIPALRELWKGDWVEWHGEHYNVPRCEMKPAPTQPVPIIGGGHSPVAFRRAVELCDGWIAAGAYRAEEARTHIATLKETMATAGRSMEGFRVYLSLGEWPDLDLYAEFRDLGVTDMICAPWMLVDAKGYSDPEALLAARMAEMDSYAERFVKPLA